MLPKCIYESPKIREYLEARGILEQYKKSKGQILGNMNSRVYFKERQPKGSGIWYFRINKKYRACGEYRGNILHISEIDDHQ